MKKKRVSVDIGGTFTDYLVLDEQGVLNMFKSSTTPKDPIQGFMNATKKAAAHYGKTVSEFLADVEVIIHGTTLATNAMLTRNMAKVGMITTKNFRDTIDLRRGIRPLDASMYNPFIPPYEPIVPRWMRHGVSERVLCDGTVKTALDLNETSKAIAQLKEQGAESIAVCFLYSYVDGRHETSACDLVKKELPGIPVVASHEVMPVWREFERYSTTVVSAALEPLVGSYLNRLTENLEEQGFSGSLLMVQANGAVQTAGQCLGQAVTLLHSGPAAAPSASVHIAEALGYKSSISFDMGGTSCDVVLIQDGHIPSTTESWVANERIGIKMIDVDSIGVGGGSLAWIDKLGLLQVGPQSAGADPGPACYGKGKGATTTDADLVLGYVPHDYFLGGEMQLDVAASEKAIQELATPLGMTVHQTAEAIFNITNQVMANQISTVVTKKGMDLRDFVLVAGGGAGPVHATAIAKLLGVRKVIVPAVAALYSAYGMFAMDLGKQYAKSFPSRLDTVDLATVNRLYADMEATAAKDFEAMGVPTKDMYLSRTVELRYVGQYHEVEVKVPNGILTGEWLATVTSAFEEVHQASFDFTMPNAKVELLTFMVKAGAKNAPFSLRTISSSGADATQAIKRHRRCVLDGEFRELPCYDGTKLLAGNKIPGPAIIEETTTTLLVPDGYTCTIDPLKNFIIDIIDSNV